MPIKAHSNAYKTRGFHPTFSTFSHVRHSPGYDEWTGEAVLLVGSGTRATDSDSHLQNDCPVSKKSRMKEAEIISEASSFLA